MNSNSKLVTEHYNSLKLDLKTRNESKVLSLRNFNNWVKSNLIQNTVYELNKYENINILDLGSGKGGDQLKWANAKVSHVTFLDIAENSVEESKSRYNKSKHGFDADFFVEDFTKCNFKNILNKKYDIISCQFAFHYCFESFEQATDTIENISFCLNSGGYFIGTTVNSFELLKRYKVSKEIGNSVYKVTFPTKKDGDETKDEFPLFGGNYDFYLEGSVDCPEFLVYPPLMDKLCSDNDLELVERLTFEEFYNKYGPTKQGRELMGRLRALEQVDLTKAQILDRMPHLQSYRERWENDKRTTNIYRTMTQEEWEVCTLYSIFMYRKK